MNTPRSTVAGPLLAALLMLLVGQSQAQTVNLPARVIEGGYNLTGRPYLSPANHPFFFAATASGSAHDKSGAGIKVARPSSGNAAVYTSAPVSSPPLLPATLGSNEKFDFKTIGDHVQAWATMTDQGVPHIWMRGAGQFKGDATVSWRTTVTVNAQQPQVVLVRLVLPSVSVSGINEQEAYALWRSRLRGELLANGFPVWSADALRLIIDPKVLTSSLQEKAVLQSFGHVFKFPSNDEDDNTSNDSPTFNQSASDKEVVFITLGTLPAGSVLDLNFMLRATAFTDPVVGDPALIGAENNNRCQKPMAELFCAQSSVLVKGGVGEAPRIYLLQP